MNTQGVRIDIGWLGDCWKTLQSRMGEFIGMSLITLVVSYLINLVIQIPFNLIFSSLLDRSVGLAFGALGVQIVVSQIAQGICYILYAGIMIFALKLLRGEPAKFEDLFAAFKNPAPYFIAGLLYGLATSVGLLACCIGAIAVSGLLMFTFPLIYDRKMGAIQAMQESVNLLKDQWPMAMAYIFCAYLFAIAGVIACGIGIIVTMPILYIAPVVAYHRMVQSPGGVNLSPSQYPRSASEMENMPATPSAWPTEAPSSNTGSENPPATSAWPSEAPSSTVAEPPADNPPQEPNNWGDTMADNSAAPAPDPSATVGETDALIDDPKPEDRPS